MNRLSLKSPRFGGHALSIMAKAKNTFFVIKKRNGNWGSFGPKLQSSQRFFWTKERPSLVTFWESLGPLCHTLAQPLFCTGPYQTSIHSLRCHWAGLRIRERDQSFSFLSQTLAAEQMEPSQRFKAAILIRTQQCEVPLWLAWDPAFKALLIARVRTCCGGFLRVQNCSSFFSCLCCRYDW